MSDCAEKSRMFKEPDYFVFVFGIVLNRLCIVGRLICGPFSNQDTAFYEASHDQ